MADTTPRPRIIDYINLTPRAPASPEDKALYDKCLALVKEFKEKFGEIVITSSFRSPETHKYLTDEHLKGLDYMHISTNRNASVDDIMSSVLRSEKAISEGKLRAAPKAVDDVPEHVKLIMLKTRLGENNGI